MSSYKSKHPLHISTVPSTYHATVKPESKESRQSKALRFSTRCEETYYLLRRNSPL